MMKGLKSDRNTHRTTYLPTYLWLYSPFWGLGHFFSFLIFYTIVRTPWTRDQPVVRQLPAHRTEQTQNKRTQTSMPQVEFEPTSPVFERMKTVHALGGAPTVIGTYRSVPGISFPSDYFNLMTN
jgi:hypothetical protein